jgi:hypothetical protein
MVSAQTDPNSAVLGVRAGPNATTYRVELYIGGVPARDFELTLDAGATRQTLLRLNREQRTQQIEARLYEGASSSAIRSVVLQARQRG